MSDLMILFMLSSMVLTPSLIARAICIRNDRASMSLLAPRWSRTW